MDGREALGAENVLEEGDVVVLVVRFEGSWREAGFAAEEGEEGVCLFFFFFFFSLLGFLFCL